MPDVVIAVALVMAGVAYALAVRHVWTNGLDGISWLEAMAFLSGVAVLAVALVSPIDGAADRRLSVHMVQHVLLVSVAAPLLVVGRPLHLVAVLTGWDVGGRILPPARAWPILVVAALAQVAVLIVWHVPVLYDAALNADPVHGLEHVTLLVSALVLWFALAQVGGEAAGATVVAVFLATLPAMALGVAMTLARTAWYPAYATRSTEPLLDQQLAGVVMWAYGGLAAVIGGVALFVRWLRTLERSFPDGQPSAAAAAGLGGAPPC